MSGLVSFVILGLAFCNSSYYASPVLPSLPTQQRLFLAIQARNQAQLRSALEAATVEATPAPVDFCFDMYAALGVPDSTEDFACPMHAAVAFWPVRVGELLEWGVPVRCPRSQMAPLEVALNLGEFGAAETLIRAGSPMAIDGQYNLLNDMYDGDLEKYLGMLDDPKTAVNARRRDGKAPLQSVLQDSLQRALPALRVLFEYGAKLSYEDGSGYTPLIGLWLNQEDIVPKFQALLKLVDPFAKVYETPIEGHIDTAPLENEVKRGLKDALVEARVKFFEAVQTRWLLEQMAFGSSHSDLTTAPEINALIAGQLDRLLLLDYQ